MSFRTWPSCLLVALLAFAGGCGRNENHESAANPQNDQPIGKPIQIAAPLGLPPVPIPANNPETEATIALGRKLFYDKRLSRDNTVSCASCHNPAMGFTDGRSRSLGVGSKSGTRNAPSVLNAAYSPLQFWDGRAPTLETQVAIPIANPIEMDQGHDIWISNLDHDAAYKAAFWKAFGPGPATMGKVEKAIAAFERTLVSGDSAFDRYEYGGDKKALSPAAIRGLQVFLNPKKGNCAACHSIGPNYALFSDGKFHNTGEGVDGEGTLLDPGRYAETKQERDRGAFKTPSLRNVALSAPYMHDGGLKTLKDVVDFYAGRGNSNPELDPQMKGITLSGKDRADLVEFLKSLTGNAPSDAGPPPQAQSKAST